MVVGGSAGITWPDNTNLPASSVTAALSPDLTNTANVMTINKAIFDGTNGLTANGQVYTSAPPYSATYLAIAGGGGGGYNSGGGGGAGGYLTSTISLAPSTVYTITIGAGGSASTGGGQGGNGSNSSINALVVATGGGLGGSFGSFNDNGGAGGSGGGG